MPCVDKICCCLCFGNTAWTDYHLEVELLLFLFRWILCRCRFFMYLNLTILVNMFLTSSNFVISGRSRDLLGCSRRCTARLHTRRASSLTGWLLQRGRLSSMFWSRRVMIVVSLPWSSALRMMAMRLLKILVMWKYVLSLFLSHHPLIILVCFCCDAPSVVLDMCY